MKIKSIFLLSLLLLANHNITYPMEKEKKQQLCPACNNRFVNLKRHLLTHTEIHPYQCKTCSNEYNDKNNARRHAILCCQRNNIPITDPKAHLTEKKVKLIYQCNTCNAQCRNGHDYHRHINSSHPGYTYAPQYVFSVTTSNDVVTIVNVPQYPTLNSNNLTTLEPLFGNNTIFDLLTNNAFSDEYNFDNLKLLQ